MDSCWPVNSLKILFNLRHIVVSSLVVVARFISITQMEDYLADVYYTPSHPSAFGGEEAVHRATKEDNKRISRREIRNWLRGRETYTLHKPLRRRFPRNRVIVSGIDSQWQADLVDVSAFLRINRGHKYTLTCIDVLSKFAWARPLKKKKGNGIVIAFWSIFREKIDNQRNRRQIKEVNF